ncbi:YCF48-related protein [Burkholderia sp. MSMB175]|uniref:WD40/YVTN/BNR-like repeat-containing protein n=1 Tax=Burkholderia sp. MSMB175 TaxID=1086510 RepID=UPI0008417258|nr:YCF48-related protein [Burkholderia sp. MSMB175]
MRNSECTFVTRFAGRVAQTALLVVLALSGGAWALGQTVTPTATPLDLLDTPAPATRNGARKLLVDVTQAGKRLVAVGDMGLIVHSDDWGVSWAQSPSPTSVMLTAVAFADERNGWAVGHDGVILATLDGGATWQRQFDGRQGDAQMLAAARASLERLRAVPNVDEKRREQAEDAVASAEQSIAAGPSRPLLGVRFFDAANGFAVGAFGQLFETGDGGRHWDYIGDRLDNGEGLHLNGITLTSDGDVLIAAEAGVVFRSRDRGHTWSRGHTGYNGYLYGVLALPGSVLLAYGFKGHAFRSVDGGQRWTAVRSGTDKTLVAGVVRSDGIPLLVDEEGQLLTSSDQAQAFRPVGARLSQRRLSGLALIGASAKLSAVTVGLGGVRIHPLASQGSQQ